MAYITNSTTGGPTGLEIAVIGMSARFPGARSIHAFWDLLVKNRTAIARFKEEEIEDPLLHKSDIRDAAYVRARGVLEDIAYFDAPLFGYTPNEAMLLDPQVRIFHECAWEALEDAGYAPYSYPGKIGVFAGAHTNALWEMSSMLAYNDMDYGNKDFLATRLCYKLNLRGPGQTVYTACSTSLVTVHMACRSLLNGECDMALAGGVSIELPQRRGYWYNEGGILSSTGYNRSFDKDADGTVFSNGAGIVVLKLLEDALKDNDNIHAVIKGSAVNNDGNWKVSFTAPSVKGQAEVVKDALLFSGVQPEELVYVEAHGSATAVGDPIEVEALKQAFGPGRRQFCGIGSVKSNIGHTNAAAGIAGLLKTVLSLKHQLVPATVNYSAPNPQLDLANSPFFVVEHNMPTGNGQAPVKMGVTSLGVGGTNAHVILEEPPVWVAEPSARKYQLLTFSARTATSLNQLLANFNQFAASGQTPALADMAYSLNTGRTVFPLRAITVGTEAHQLESPRFPGNAGACSNTVLVFPGEQGYATGQGSGIYGHEQGFKALLDHCFEICVRTTGISLQAGTGPAGALDTAGQERVMAFCVQYALGAYLAGLGISSGHLTGYSAGKQVAQCLSGATSLEEAFTALLLPQGNLAATTDLAVENILQLTGARILIAGHDPALVDSLSRHPLFDAGRHIIISLLPPGAEPDAEAHYFTTQLGNTWLHGQEIDWNAYYRFEMRRKVTLPAYAFDRKQYWIDQVDLPLLRQQLPSATERKADPQDWLYYPVWRQQLPDARQERPVDENECWLVFAWKDELAAALEQLLVSRGQNVTLVYPGNSYQHQDHSYTINVEESGDYVKLLQHLQESGRLPRRVIHAWNVASFGNGDAAAFEAAQHYGYYSLVYLAQAVFHRHILSPLAITVVTTGVQDITGAEIIAREKATLLGPLLVLPQENAQLSISNIDLDAASLQQAAVAAAQIMKENVLPGAGRIAGYRYGRRWVEDHQPYRSLPAAPAVQLFREKGVYLILGGTGNIGLHMARYISRQVKAHIILCSRTGLVAHSAARSALLKEVERNGCTVSVRSVQVDSKPEMQQLWKEVYAAYGHITAVIHAAGIMHACPLETLSPELAAGQFAAKAQGLYILNELFHEFAAPEYCLLMSSLSAVLGGIGFTAYSAANAFMDYFARSQRSNPTTRWLSLNWDSWQFDHEGPGQMTGNRRPTFVMQPEEALEAFHKALAIQDVSQVLVSAGDLQLRKAKYLEQHREEAPGPAQEPAAVQADNYEPAITALLEKHLGYQGIQPGDDFFALGGDSFLLLALVNDLKKTFGKSITVKECYEHATVAGLAALVRSKKEKPAGALKAAEKKEYYRLSPAQYRMYYQYALDPGSLAYNETKIFEATGNIDKDRLEQAFLRLIARHESLRTSFRAIGEETVQVVHDAVDFRLDVFDQVKDPIRDFAAAYVQPFDFSRPPLFRVAFAGHVSGKVYLVADFHHIICDAASMSIIMQELTAIYNAWPLPPVPLQYKDVAEYYNSAAFLKGYKIQQDYWLDALKACSPPVMLPADFPAAGEITAEAYEEVVLSGDDLQEARKIVQEEGVSLFSLLAGIFAALVARYTGTADIITGVPVSGRTDASCNGTVGMFVNILPLRLRPGPGKSFAGYLQEVHRANVGLLQHQDYPYNDLVRELKYTLGTEHPLFSMVFNFISLHQQEDDGGNGLSLKEIGFMGNRVTKYHFILNASEGKDRVYLGINYSPQQYSPATIRSFLLRYLEMLSSVISDRELVLQNTAIDNLHAATVQKNDPEDPDFYFGE